MVSTKCLVLNGRRGLIKHKTMSKKKRYEYHDSYERDAYEDRNNNTKKRAMRSDHKDRWRYNQSEDHESSADWKNDKRYR